MVAVAKRRADSLTAIAPFPVVLSASSSDNTPDGSFVAFAHHMADVADAVLRRYFRAVSVQTKEDASPVTQADREAEAAMRTLIESHYKDHGIIGEEYGNSHTDRRYVWVLDPIDGTLSYATGYAHFGTLIALLEDGVPIVGLAHAPIMGDRWLGARGQPTTLNGIPVRQETATQIQDIMPDTAWITSSSPEMFDTDAQVRAWRAVRGASSRAAVYSGNCIGYGLVASGHVNILCEANTKPYDYMAGVPIVEGAGGVISDWQGNALTIHSGGEVLACSHAPLHQAGLEIIAAS